MVAGMHMLRWMSGHTLKDRMPNEDVIKGLGFTDKLSD